MSYEKIANGALFKNDNVQGNGPEYSGKGEMEDGTPVQFAAWVKESQNGRKYFSIAITKKNEAPQEQQPGPGGHDDFGDEIPFSWRGIARV